jgi:hypothetical protein
MLLSWLADMPGALIFQRGVSSAKGGESMKNPLESLPWTIVLGVVLTVILVVILNAVGV